MKLGKIYKYNEITGIIVSDNIEYYFSYDNLLEKIEVDDLVTFRPFKVSTPDTYRFFAKDIKKFKNN